jgi:hypothetical protein
MKRSLIDSLREVPDFRRSQGQRYPLESALTMIIMAIMSGRYGYREIGMFLKVNRQELIESLALDKPMVPSHVTVRTLLRGIDFQALCQSFCAWARQHVEITADEVFSIDGKALGSTVTQQPTSQQEFICLVSLYSQRQGSVLSLARYNNGHRSEIPTVTELIAALDLTGVTLSLDALHCQKKLSPQSSAVATSI